MENEIMNNETMDAVAGAVEYSKGDILKSVAKFGVTAGVIAAVVVLTKKVIAKRRAQKAQKAVEADYQEIVEDNDSEE